MNSNKKELAKEERLKPKLMVNIPFAITIAPCNEKQYITPQNKDNRNRYQLFRAYWARYIEKLSLHNVILRMTIEISEPFNCKKDSIGPRLHLHGTIEFKTRNGLQNFLLYEYQKLLNYNHIDIDTIDDSDYWDRYCTKQHILPKDRHINPNLEERGSNADAAPEGAPGTEPGAGRLAGQDQKK